VWLLSGDDPARVTQTARVAGIPSDHAVGHASAEGKASFAARHDHRDLLMIGDGINDSLVVAQAFCSGTPAIDRPFMAARSDFYFVTPGLRCIRLALRAATKLAEVRRRNLTIAVAYNVLTVSLAYAGVMSPLLCAVLMPASSLTTILAAMASLSPGRPLWRS
jgi:Cu2+-exporting ATPase